MYCQGKSSSCPFFLSFLPRPPSLASLEPPIYPPPPRVPRSLPLSGISFRFLSKAHPVSASYPSSFKSVGLPFKGIEISFGDIKPPLNRPLIQVGFGNFFFSVYPPVLCSPERAHAATVRSGQSRHFCVYPHARMVREGGNNPVIQLRTYLGLLSREGIRTVKAGDRLVLSVFFSPLFATSRYFILSR